MLYNPKIKNELKRLPNITKGNTLIKDYESLNFSLHSHPMALLRHILNKKY